MKYIAIYKTLISLNFSTLFTYRANFINSMVTSVIWGFMSIFLMIVLTQGNTSVFGWSRDELLILVGIYNVSVGLFHTLFSRNFGRFSDIIHFGQLDTVLTKPVDSQFLLSFWLINFTTLFRIIFGAAFVVYIIVRSNISVTPISILFFLILAIFGVVLLYSIWYIIITFTIWFTRLSNLVDLMYEVNGATRFPAQMFFELGSFVTIIFLPLTYVINTPVRVLLEKGTISEVSGLLLTSCLFLYASRTFWKFALKFYTSASG